MAAGSMASPSLHAAEATARAAAGGLPAVSFSDDERAELIGALSRSADMVGRLLDALDVLRVDLEAGRQPSAGDLERLREHSALWRRQLEKLRSRLSGLTIEPPSRVQ